MTPRPVRALARTLGFVLAIAIGSAAAQAGGLYRWVTEDGRVEIGPTPPRGTPAIPWLPGQEGPTQPAPPSTPAPAPRALSNEGCASRREAARKAEREVLEMESEIARLERTIETLEASEVAYSRTSCVSQNLYDSISDCQSEIFHRDREIANAEQALDIAQEKLGDLELRARGSALPAECAHASAD